MTYGRLWHDFNLCHTHGSLADARTDTIRSCITATDDENPFALGIYQTVFGERFSIEDMILLGQHFEGKINTFQFASGDIEVACLRRPGADAVGIKARGEVLYIYRYAHFELDAFGFKHSHPAVDYCLIEFKIRNTIAQ